MLLHHLFRAISASLLFSRPTSGSPVKSLDGRQATLEDFIKTQSEISIKGVLANIGPDGSKVQGAAAGIVVASPSRSDPDCTLFHIIDEEFG